MPDALKTDATKVRGCSASVWVYPTTADGRLHFLADSNAAITKGIVALILSAVQDRPADEVARMDVAEALAPFELRKHLSANRTQGVPNMIALIRETAERLRRVNEPSRSLPTRSIRHVLRARSQGRPRPGAGPRISRVADRTGWSSAFPGARNLVGVPETGVLASGAIVSLIDTASGASVWMKLGHFVPIVTLDLRLDYMRPAVKGETVIARCEC